MGVPADIAMWLIKLDIGGAFVLYSSHTKKRLDKIDMVSQHDTSHHAMIRSLGLSPNVAAPKEMSNLCCPGFSSSTP
jgi:hypothetical protein